MALATISAVSHAAAVTELPDGVEQQMPGVNRVIAGGSNEGQFGVRFGTDNALTLRVTDDQGAAANWFFGLTSQWGFSNPDEQFWLGSPAFATTGLFQGRFLLTFDTPQAGFLGRFNWDRAGTLKAFGSSDKLLETVSFAGPAAGKPGFYGFRRSSSDISRIEFSGYNIGIRSISTLASTPSVPEPATWAFMILGFGAVGATLRRRGPAWAYA